MEIYTSKGWQDMDESELFSVTCCDCPEPAVTITDAGKGALWAQCEGCADETRACSIDARRVAEYECEA